MFQFRNANHASSTLRRSLDHKVQLPGQAEPEDRRETLWAVDEGNPMSWNFSSLILASIGKCLTRKK
jgi:hypothetical protein